MDPVNVSSVPIQCVETRASVRTPCLNARIVLVLFSSTIVFVVTQSVCMEHSWQKTGTVLGKTRLLPRRPVVT